MQNWSADAVFSSLTLHQAFQFWIVANCLSQGQGRNQRPNIHAYELLWYSVQKKPILNTDKASWNDLNRELRSLFFYELEKLKQSLRQTPEQMFNHWGEQATQLTLLKRQHQQAHLALYDYSQYGNNSNKIQSLGGQKKISGVVFKVDKPSCFYQPIPHQCILVAPYFSNEWIVSIQYIKAIIVEQGGQLSHSAIVARELSIPYLVVKQGTLSQFKHNESLMVDSMTYQITHYKTSD